jgi:hypothetical protein
MRSRIFLDGGWRRYVRPKRRLTFNELHGVISQKKIMFSHGHPTGSYSGPCIPCHAPKYVVSFTVTSPQAGLPPLNGCSHLNVHYRPLHSCPPCLEAAYSTATLFIAKETQCQVFCFSCVATTQERLF